MFIIEKRSHHETTITFKVFKKRGRHGLQRLAVGTAPITPKGKRLRVSRLMALAVLLRDTFDAGHYKSQAAAAENFGVAASRIGQILDLTFLAPDIQEALLSLPRKTKGRDPITEGKIRPIAREIDWRKQRVMWRELLNGTKIGEDGW